MDDLDNLARLAEQTRNAEAHAETMTRVRDLEIRRLVQKGGLTNVAIAEAADMSEGRVRQIALKGNDDAQPNGDHSP